MANAHFQITLDSDSAYLKVKDPIRQRNFEIGDMVIVCANTGEAFSLEGLVASSFQCPFCRDLIKIEIQSQSTQTYLSPAHDKTLKTKDVKEAYPARRITRVPLWKFAGIGGIAMIVISFAIIAAYLIVNMLTRSASGNGSTNGPRPLETPTAAIFHTSQPPALAPTRFVVPSTTQPNIALQNQSSNTYVLTFASDKDGSLNVYLMNPENGDWKKLNRPSGYDVAIWPSFCGNEVAAELQDTQGLNVQWIYLINPDSGDTNRWSADGVPTELGVPRCSPDGQFLAYSENMNSKWLMKVDTFPQGNNSLTISNNPIVGYASWYWNTHDMLYMTYRAGTFRILRMLNLDSNQIGDISPTRTSEGNKIIQWEFPAISPDGSQVAFVCQLDNEEYWLCVTNLSNNATRALQEIQIVNTRWDRWQIISAGTPVWSQNGNWIYFSSAETGNFDIYRIHSDGSGKQDLTSEWSSNEIMPNTR
jgi:Tol biopolymer transport system component